MLSVSRLTGNKWAMCRAGAIICHRSCIPGITLMWCAPCQCVTCASLAHSLHFPAAHPSILVGRQNILPSLEAVLSASAVDILHSPLFPYSHPSTSLPLPLSSFLLSTQSVSPFEKQIQRDLTRTFPEHDFFRNGPGQEALQNLLKVWC